MQGVPFRDAHHQVGAWVLEAMEKGCALNGIIKKEDTETTVSQDIHLQPNQVLHQKIKAPGQNQAFTHWHGIKCSRTPGNT